MEKREARVILEAPRLALRRFTGDDADNLFALDRDPAVMRYPGGMGGYDASRAAVTARVV
jgi:hypothetical protein